MPPKILHVLSQRPSRTGSGITLDAVVRQAAKNQWDQAAVVGIPAGDKNVLVGHLNPKAIHPLFFSDPDKVSAPSDLNFPVPGMSDVMPYPSTVFSTLGARELSDYRTVWTRHLKKVVQEFEPDLIHSNHIWLLSSLLKDIAPHLPVVTTCHATGLRQLDLCPHLADEVIAGCRRNDHFFVLRRDHGALLAKTLGVSGDKISLAGVGYRDEIFNTSGVSARRDLLYVGKFSNSKGLPWLLDAFEELKKKRPRLRLHIAGGGSGSEAETLLLRMQAMAPSVVLHGMLDQGNLARLMRRILVCVLPSFYEGVPLVLVEAAACGCRLVSTQLPGVEEQIAPKLGSSLEMIPLPRLVNVDQPLAEDLPQFIQNLLSTLIASLDAPEKQTPDLSFFTWKAVFQRVESVWQRFTA